MSRSDYSIANQWWELEIQNNCNKNFLYKLHSKINDVVYADQDYHYRIVRSKKKGSRYIYLDHLGLEYKAKSLAERTIRMINKEKLLMEGIFRDTEIKIEHEFELKKDSKWLREFITIKNQGK